MLIAQACAQEPDVDFTEIPTLIGERLGIGEFAGGLFASAILCLMFIMPVALISRRKKAGIIPEIAMTFITMGACIAMGWLDYWMFLVIIILICAMWANTIKNWIG